MRLAGGRITLRGHVTRPLPRKAQTVTVTAQTDCTTRRAAGRTRLDRRGRFTITFAMPTGVPEILVRAQTQVPTRAGGPAGFRTFTLPRPLALL